ncbi:MAG: acetate--CoA ligase family protein, partial [Bacteroidales bacterium]
TIIDYVDNDFDEIDGMVVIFGTPGLFKLFDVYKVLDEKMKKAKKPIYPVLPSILTAKEEMEDFISKGRVNFPDEVTLGNALAKVYHTNKPLLMKACTSHVDEGLIRAIIDTSENGYLSPEAVQGLLDAAGIPRAGEAVVTDKLKAIAAAAKLGYPVVMKVVGPVHKSDVGGVILNVKDATTVEKEFERMMQIKDTTAILIQPMLSGTELFVGANFEDKFGHLVMCGMGGIFIEVLKDINAGLVPIGKVEATQMVRNLKSYKIIQGVRGQEGINEEQFTEVIMAVSTLLSVAPEIKEMDINPLLGKKDKVVAVDARIRIEK